jgi:uncharacterized protein with TBP-like fold DUF4468
MKTTILVLVLALFVKITVAQQELLSFDEHNKYIYYQVADAPGLPADSLHARGLSFLKRYYPKIKLKTTAGEENISGQGKFLSYGGVSVLKREKGEIAFQLNIEFKDQKYRYWLTEFVCTPYQRDRYGNFVPEPGIDIPLENAISKFEKKDVDDYLNDTGAFCKQFGDHLKQFIINLNPPKKEEITKKVVTDKW